jgi:crotonobetainyl-CoA:carnitine CoA-transferase CaiB-like acyl-CoA transferase
VVAVGNPEGLSIPRDLVARCDVVLVNFSPRVFDRFGLTDGAVREINPGVVYARMPAFGLDGPWRDRVGFTQTMEQLTGMAELTGFPDTPPKIMNGPCDPLAGYHTVFAVLAALRASRLDDKGRAIEASRLGWRSAPRP